MNRIFRCQVPGNGSAVNFAEAARVEAPPRMWYDALKGVRGGVSVRKICWIVGAGDRVMRREVTLGELFGRDRVVVDSGVAPGERVVTAGVYQLREGERVRILN